MSHANVLVAAALSINCRRWSSDDTTHVCQPALAKKLWKIEARAPTCAFTQRSINSCTLGPVRHDARRDVQSAASYSLAFLAILHISKQYMAKRHVLRQLTSKCTSFATCNWLSKCKRPMFRLAAQQPSTSWMHLAQLIESINIWTSLDSFLNTTSLDKLARARTKTDSA